MREAIFLLALGSVNGGLALRIMEPMLPQLAAQFGASVSAMDLAVGFVDYSPAIIAFGLGFLALGAWMRANLDRLS